MYSCKVVSIVGSDGIVIGAIVADNPAAFSFTCDIAIGQIGGRLLRSIVIIYAARILGAGEWGVFSYAITFVAFITSFTDIGINPILTRETARKIDSHQKDHMDLIEYGVSVARRGWATKNDILNAQPYAEFKKWLIT